jgi:hypothetical protein
MEGTDCPVIWDSPTDTESSIVPCGQNGKAISLVKSLPVISHSTGNGISAVTYLLSFLVCQGLPFL